MLFVLGFASGVAGMAIAGIAFLWLVVGTPYPPYPQ